MFKLNFILEQSRSFPGHFEYTEYTCILLPKTGLRSMYLYNSYTLIVLLAFPVHASGEFIVLHSPDSVEFTVNGEIEQSNLKEFLSAALGYTGKQVHL